MNIFEKYLPKLTVPEYLFLGLLIVRPTLDFWRDINLFNIADHPVNLMAVLSLFIAFVSLTIIVPQLKKLKNNPITIPFLIFIALAVVSIIYSFNLTSTVLETLKLINLFLIFCAGYLIIKNNPRLDKSLILAILYAAGVPVLFAIYQWLTLSGMTIFPSVNRAYGTFAHPNILAIFSLVVLAALAKWYEHPVRTHHPLLAHSIPVIIFAIFATQTRVAWLALVLWLIIDIFLTHRKLFWKLSGAGFSLIVIFSAIFLALPVSYQETIKSLPLINRFTYRPTNADSIEWRQIVARDSLKIFTLKPIFGFGYGTFPNVWDNYKDPVRRGDPSNEAHNDYVRILIEEGLVGMVAYLFLFATLLKISWSKYKTNKQSKIFFISVVLYCFVALSDNMLHHTPPDWWLLMLWGAWSAE